MRAPLALLPLLAVLQLPLAGCGSSTPKDINYGTDAGAGFDAPAREVRASDGATDTAGGGGTAGGGTGGSDGAAGAAGTGDDAAGGAAGASS